MDAMRVGAMMFGMSDFEAREQHIKEHGFVKVSDELVAALKPYCLGRVVEVMAGVGHLAAKLRAAGVTLEASDDFSWHGARGWRPQTEVIKRHAADACVDADTVIMLWPYMDEGAADVAARMKPGAALIYCGEGRGGCTASDDFFERVNTWAYDKAFDKRVNKHHHVWHGLYDHWSRWVKP